MTSEKYLFWFRYCFPNNWANKYERDVEELFFIIAKSESEALNHGNEIVQNFIGNLFAENNYRSKKIVFTSFIWEGWENSDEEVKKELAGFPVVNCSEFPNLNFEIKS
jgi:hypothetical protein